MIYGVVSDLHCHTWTLFSGTNGDGLNSRLAIILSELERAAQVVVDQGGDTLIFAGDLFHTRGVIDPEVLNPVRASFERIGALGLISYIIPGNHDLKSRETCELSSAVQNLAGPNVIIMNRAHVRKSGGAGSVAFVPWRYELGDLLVDLEELAYEGSCDPAMTDVFIHAGIDGVLSGVPGSGLTAQKLASFGFRRIFAGHYHNHKDMGGGVVSIGATTHHNWGDVGTRAGFLTVDARDGTFKFHDTLAPKFVDVSGLDEMEMELECKGNYVRFRGPMMTQDDITALRDQFKAWGALGTSIEVPRAVTTQRAAAPAKGITLEQSVDGFIADMQIPAHIDKDRVRKRAAEILAQTRAVVEEA